MAVLLLLIVDLKLDLLRSRFDLKLDVLRFMVDFEISCFGSKLDFAITAFFAVARLLISDFFSIAISSSVGDVGICTELATGPSCILSGLFFS